MCPALVGQCAVRDFPMKTALYLRCILSFSSNMLLRLSSLWPPVELWLFDNPSLAKLWTLLEPENIHNDPDHKITRTRDEYVHYVC